MYRVEQTQSELQRAKELLSKVRSMRERLRNQRIYYYRPIGNQSKFHAADSADVRVVFGGNRSGKTTCGAVEAVAHALGFRPWLREGHPDYYVHNAAGNPIPVPNVGRIVAENFEVSVKQTIVPKLMEWIPAGKIAKIDKNQRSVVNRIEFTNGSVIHILSNDQDDRAFEGPNGHWAWFDEPTTQRKFNGIRRGLVDYDGTCWMTMTPLAEPWINDTLVDKANGPDGRIKVYYYSIWDNCTDNGGTLSRRAIMSFLDDVDEDERQAREHGIPLHLTGRVFPKWRPEPPYWVPEFELSETWPRVCVIDPHPRKPIAVLWAAISPDNIVYVYRSLFDKKLETVEDVSAEIKRLEGWRDVGFRTERDEYVALRIIDTSANEEERTSGETVAEQFANNGLACIDAYKRNKDAGLKAIKQALKIKYGWGKPGLVVMDCCPEVKQNFQNYVWERWQSSRQQGQKGEKQETMKVHDDFIDCIRYIYQMRLTFHMLRGFTKKLYRTEDREEFGNPLDIENKGRWGLKQRDRKRATPSSRWVTAKRR